MLPQHRNDPLNRHIGVDPQALAARPSMAKRLRSQNKPQEWQARRFAQAERFIRSAAPQPGTYHRGL